jgi:hypothetical protein
MLTWLKKQWAVFKVWRRANEKAHEKAPTRACCSSPPPGAGRQDGKGG